MRDRATTFKVTVLGGKDVSYQWQRNGVDVPGATGPVFKLIMGNTTGIASVRCVVSNAFGADTTGRAIISRVFSSATLPAPVDGHLLTNLGHVPLHYELEQNYPNPFNPTTTLKYAIPKESRVQLDVFNLLGEVVATLEDQVRQPGYYEATFDGRNVASGVYLYRIRAGDFVMTKKLVLLK